MNNDKKFMARALALAEKGRGLTNPNPLVGAIVVKKGKILAEGYHKKAGEEHAEINALKKLNFKADGATLYVTLEPCCHFGRTGPCTEKIIASGIKRVVAGTADPNKMVCGKGFNHLTKSGIEIQSGVLEEKAISQNEHFFKFIQKGLPFVTIKGATTLDGKIALPDGSAKWISSKKTLEFTHKNRTKYDAILVGIGTVIKDDPLLEPTKKPKNRKNPAKIIIDPSLKINPSSRLIRENQDSDIFIFTTKQASKAKSRMFRMMSFIHVIEMDCKNNIISVKEILKKLAKESIMSILVEGGGKTHGHFINEKMADKIVLYYSPKIFGLKESKNFVDGLNVSTIEGAPIIKNYKLKRLGDDFVVEGYFEYR